MRETNNETNDGAIGCLAMITAVIVCIVALVMGGPIVRDCFRNPENYKNCVATVEYGDGIENKEIKWVCTNAISIDVEKSMDIGTCGSKVVVKHFDGSKVVRTTLMCRNLRYAELKGQP